MPESVGLNLNFNETALMMLPMTICVAESFRRGVMGSGEGVLLRPHDDLEKWRTTKKTF